MTSQQPFPSHWDNIPPPIPYSSRPTGPTAATTAKEELKEPCNPNQPAAPGTPRFESHSNNTSHSIHAASSQVPQPKPDHPTANPTPVIQQATHTEQHQQQPEFASHWDNAPQPTDTSKKGDVQKEAGMEDLVGLMKGASIAEGPAKVEGKKGGQGEPTGFPSHWDLVDSGVLQGLKHGSDVPNTPQPQQESRHHRMFSSLSRKAEAVKETMRETVTETVQHLASFNPKHVEKEKTHSTTSASTTSAATKFASHWDLVDSGVLPPPSGTPLPKPSPETSNTKAPTETHQPKVDSTASALEAFTNLKISDESEAPKKQATDAPPGETKFPSHWDTVNSQTANAHSTSTPLPAPTLEAITKLEITEEPEPLKKQTPDTGTEAPCNQPVETEFASHWDTVHSQPANAASTSTPAPPHKPTPINPPAPPAPTESLLFPHFDPSSPPPIPSPSSPSPLPTDHNPSRSAAHNLLWNNTNPNAPKTDGVALDMPEAVPTDPTLEALDWPAAGEVVEDKSVRFREEGKVEPGYGGHWGGAFVEEEEGGVKLERRD